MDGFVVLGLWLGVFVDCGRGSGFCSQWWGLWVAAFGVESVDGGLVLVYPLHKFFFFVDCGFLWVASGGGGGGVRCVYCSGGDLLVVVVVVSVDLW